MHLFALDSPDSCPRDSFWEFCFAEFQRGDTALPHCSTHPWSAQLWPLHLVETETQKKAHFSTWLLHTDPILYSLLRSPFQFLHDLNIRNSILSWSQHPACEQTDSLHTVYLFYPFIWSFASSHAEVPLRLLSRHNSQSHDRKINCSAVPHFSAKNISISSACAIHITLLTHLANVTGTTNYYYI